MKILDRLSRFLGDRTQIPSNFPNHTLDPIEIRLIADGRVEGLADFAASPRLHLMDLKGDTPLHLAARIGNLALCDLFVRSGSNPRAINHQRQTPADVALAEGHHIVAKLLLALVERPRDLPISETIEETPKADNTADKIEVVTAPSCDGGPPPKQIESLENLEGLLNFEAEEEAGDFFYQSANETASGTFVALVGSSPLVSAGKMGDWEFDLSPIQIAGEGIGSEAITTPDRGGEYDFLKVRKRGRRSVKRAVVQSGTRLSIDFDVCRNWTISILERGWFSFDDIESLTSFCDGNGDYEELKVNLRRTLEAAGLELFDGSSESLDILWNAKTNVLGNDLIEAVEATFSRDTRVPGTQRFDMGSTNEARLLEPINRAKQELQLGILACEPAVETILNVIDDIFHGYIDPNIVTLRTIYPSRPGHVETTEFFDAAENLKTWKTEGRVMDGRRRREALEALNELDFSLEFQKEMVESIARDHTSFEDSALLEGLISAFEIATERLILEHLSYARRFASRNVEEGEDLEDVFQVAFMGLQRSTRRFDPERGRRFVIYCTIWMRQVLARWRADEGTIIRIPVHQYQRLTDLDRAVDRLAARNVRTPTKVELASELEWDAEVVELLSQIPRQCCDLTGLAECERAISGLEQEDVFDRGETERIVSEILAELPERQAEVIRMRFGIGRDQEMTLEEIGQIYGVTRERIRQIEAKGLDHLSHPGRKRRIQTLMGL